MQVSLNPSEALRVAEQAFRDASEKAAAALLAKQLATEESKAAVEHQMKCYEELLYRRKADADGQTPLEG